MSFKLFLNRFLVSSISTITLLCGSSLASAMDYSIAVNEAGETNRLIVKYKSGVSSRVSESASFHSLSSSFSENHRERVADFLEKAGIDSKVIRSLRSGAELVALRQELTEIEIDQAVVTLSKDENVEYVVRDAVMYPTAVPNDPRYNEQWHYGTYSSGGINLEAAWDITQGSGVKVAVLDTGILYDHDDLADNLLPGYDFITDSSAARDGNGRDSDASDEGDWGDCGRGYRTSSWHGSHVAGTIAAVTNNDIGVAGIAYESKIVPVRVLGRCGGMLSDISDAILYAAGISAPGIPTNPNPAQVINMSLGGGGACDRAYQDVIDQAVAAGVTVVVAAGNDSSDASGYRPSSCRNVISVAASERDRSLAPFTNYGSLIDVVAPGGYHARNSNPQDGVWSTVDSGSERPVSDAYDSFNGTSMAAPHVAGVVALMYSVKPNITPAQVESILKSTAAPIGETTVESCLFGDFWCREVSVSIPDNTGILDAEEAVKAAMSL